MSYQLEDKSRQNCYREANRGKMSGKVITILVLVLCLVAVIDCQAPEVLAARQALQNIQRIANNARASLLAAVSNAVEQIQNVVEQAIDQV